MKSRRPTKSALLAAAAVLAMIGGPDAGATVHEVRQEAEEFVPAIVVALPGDTIVWTWSTGIHTVTSGAPCVADGFIQAQLNASSPVVEFTVPNVTGTIVYHCEFGCNVNHVGFVVVPPVPGDVNGDFEVDILDALFIWASIGACPIAMPCPADLNGSGMVDFEDLWLLFLVGPCCALDFSGDGEIGVIDLILFLAFLGVI